MKVTTAKEIGALIRDRRHVMKWGQQQLADRVGVSRLWISEIENGKPTVQLNLVLKTLQALGVQLEFDSNGTVKSPDSRRSEDLIRNMLKDRGR